MQTMKCARVLLLVLLTLPPTLALLGCGGGNTGTGGSNTTTGKTPDEVLKEAQAKGAAK